MTDSITIRRLADLHCHFRNGDMLKAVVPHTARYASHAVAMPNTAPEAILTASDADRYFEEIWAVQDKLPDPQHFDPVMTIAIRDNTTTAMIEAAAKSRVAAGKVYPLGVTTNSQNGLRAFHSPSILETFKAMADCGMPLLIHGEIDQPRTLVTEREHTFLPIFSFLVESVPNLPIVFEHVSTRLGVELVKSLPDNVAATITAHHLCLTLNDVIGSGVQPHHMCMPVPKDFDDRDALIAAAISGNPKFFLGSDSAPHARANKECARGACGVYTAPILPELLAEIFEQHNALDRLEGFTSTFASNFYWLTPSTKTITLRKEPWTVPDEFNGIVPFRAGTTMQWKQAL